MRRNIHYFQKFLGEHIGPGTRVGILKARKISRENKGQRVRICKAGKQRGPVS